MSALKPTLLDCLLLALTLVAGYMDALSYLGLNGAFTANMTGNLVLLGLAAGQAAGDRALGSGIAFVGFAIGVASGGRIAGHEEVNEVWPRSVTVTVGVEIVVLALFALVWFLTQGESSGLSRDILLASASFAMGTQSAVGRRLGVSGVTTTYVTGTLTSLMAAVVGPTGASVAWLRWGGVLAVTVFGALIGAVTLRLWPSLAALPPLAVVITVAIAAAVRYRSAGQAA